MNNEHESLVRSDTVLISSCFTEVWTGITALTVTDFLSPSLRSILWGRCLRSGWQTIQSTFSYTLNLLLLLSYLTDTITILHIPLGTSCLIIRICHPKIWIFIYYSDLPPVICLETLLFCHVIQSPITLGSKHSPATLELRQSNNPNDPYQKNRKTLNFYWKSRAKTCD